MKHISPLIVALTLAGAVPLPAEDWKSLSGIGDEVVLAAGETALIVSVSDELLVRYEKPGRDRAAFYLQPANTSGRWSYTRRFSNWRTDRTMENATVSAVRPFALTGPCTISLRSPGVVSMRVVGSASDNTVAMTGQKAEPAPRRLPIPTRGWVRMGK